MPAPCIGGIGIFRWRAVAQGGAAVALKRDAQRTPRKNDPEARHKADIEWHTDVMYVWVAARFYLLVSFVDAYSHYIVHHKPLMSIDGKSVAVEFQAALEAAKDARPRVVHDHGSDFVNPDVMTVIKAHNPLRASMARCAPRATTTTATTTCRARRSSPSSCTITTTSDYMRH